MKLREIFVSGIWLASAVEVFGFTFEAFKNTYEQFPIGGAAQVASGNAPNVLPQKGTPVNPKTHKFRSPPANLVNPVIKAVQEGSGTRALAAWNKVLQWVNTPQAKAEGWFIFDPKTGKSSLLDWAFSQGWFGRFYDLTGWTPGGLSNAGRPTNKKGPIG